MGLARTGQPARVGDQITDSRTGHTYTLAAREGDTTCPTCGGLVRNWTRYTLTNWPCRRGAEQYDQRPDSAHALDNGLSGPCPARAN